MRLTGVQHRSGLAARPFSGSTLKRLVEGHFSGLTAALAARWLQHAGPRRRHPVHPERPHPPCRFA
jgi:hypothetical protein